MAKKLKELKAKLGELQGPEDNTVATKNFYRTHKTVEHPDPAGNGDDVFKASNVRTVNRSPDHGYEPGKDEEVYENAYNNRVMKRMDKSEGPLADSRRKAISKLSISARSLLAPSLEDRPDRKKMGQDIRDGEYDEQIPKRLNNSYEPQGNKINETELTPERHAAAWLAATLKGQRTRQSFSRHMGKAGFVNFDTTQFKKGRDIGYNQVVSNQNNLLRSLSYGLSDSYEPEGNKIAEIFKHLSEKNKKHFIDILGEEDGYERIAEAFGLAEEE
jgi:hypothetical protein